MNSSTSTHTSASVSKAIISGVPSQLSYLIEVLSDPGTIISNAVNKALTEEVGELRSTLMWSHAEYSAIASSFDIEWDSASKSFVYVVDAPMGTRAREIEYGSPDEPAARVQTTAAVHRARYLESKIQKYLNEELGVK